MLLYVYMYVYSLLLVHIRPCRAKCNTMSSLFSHIFPPFVESWRITATVKVILFFNSFLFFFFSSFSGNTGKYLYLPKCWYMYIFIYIFIINFIYIYICLCMCLCACIVLCMYMYMYYVNCLFNTCRCECVYILFFLTIVRIRF